MGKYILKRILFFIPTLIIISVLAFIISIHAPGDPLDRMVSAKDAGGDAELQSPNTEKEIARWRHKLGLDLPVFYLRITGSATPDTLYKFYDDNEQTALKRLIHTYGNWDAIATWNNSVKACMSSVRSFTIPSPDSTQTHLADTLIDIRFSTAALLYAYDEKIIQQQLHTIRKTIEHNPELLPLQPVFEKASADMQQVIERQTRYKNYIPAIHFYPYNQYHRWIFGDGNIFTGKKYTECGGLIRGDFGYSYETKLPVSDVIGERIRWSLFFTLISVMLAYLISIPVGIRAAAKKNSLFDRTSSVLLFILYSMPAFWVATLLLMTFANTEVLSLFPPSGIQPATGIPEGTGWLGAIRLRLPYLVLPTIAYTYSQLAFLSRITRVGTLEIIAQDYIRTARAKGLSESKVIYKHAFRNALLPVITVFSNIFPWAVSGSVILETVFTIPGMGQQIYHAILTKDYPVIIDVFTLTGILTLTGYLLADILYAWADPRISFTSK